MLKPETNHSKLVVKVNKLKVGCDNSE